MQAWKWADLEDEKNTIKYDKRSRPMKFCVIRTRRRHVVFTFIACVCLEGIGAHIHSKVLVVVLYWVKLSLFARRTNDLSGKRALWKNDYSWAIPQLFFSFTSYIFHLANSKLYKLFSSRKSWEKKKLIRRHKKHKALAKQNQRFDISI